MELEQARTFLAALAGGDGWDTPVTFQTFDDRPERDPRLARIFHGSLRRHAAALDALNGRGAGVFVTVQETDGRGRREENIVALRACFIDCDGPRKQRFALRPSLAVQTRHGGHAFWRLEQGQDRARFRAIQQQLAAYYGSDPAVCDLPRVMRLPGTLHRKEAPVLVRLALHHPELRYTLDAIASAHPVPACATNRRVVVRARAAITTAGPPACWHPTDVATRLPSRSPPKGFLGVSHSAKLRALWTPTASGRAFRMKRPPSSHRRMRTCGAGCPEPDRTRHCVNAARRIPSRQVAYGSS